MARTLRRKLAQHAAERLLAGDAAVIDELAALIIAERREREVDLLVQDIEAKLAERGTVVATVESATPLDTVTKDKIKNLLSSKTNASNQDINVLLRESIDQALIGGFKLRTPTATLDATIAKKLNDLRAKKI
ncbi:F0F1 ATP synthase subunit delta [Candidatus Saccharibacteria bacterium oral taxon 488]|jgi:hypothetical protein|nr:F0F1 ATP synthase subunit delta [Candidatus Saccharibacteria bacterium oral taxon 488]QJU10903.1 F0F1 ATP synthase subunit delta [Candidatus Saccharibacteria bacterium oral taxon 488]QLF51788.1 F0F1 ATP synthase subunit delta [Candidatus Saccharibacteria bacterium oral taxon 488]